MSKYPGRVLSATPPSVSQSGASGVWTQEEVAQYVQENIWPTQFPEDPFFQDTVLLLHGDGTNGAQNNTFLDSSTNNFTITRNGNTTQGSLSPFVKPTGRWGAFTSDRAYLTIPASGDFDLISTDFTVEFWLNWDTQNTMGFSGTNFIGNMAVSNGYFFGMSSTSASTFSSLNFSVWNAGSATSNINTSITQAVIPAGEWHHIAIVRNGTGAGNLKFYVDGVQIGSAYNSVTYSTAGSTLSIGSGAYIQNPTYSGNAAYSISNLRLTKSAVYTSDFTPSTSPLTALANTTLLMFQDNRFINNGSNAGAITSSTFSTTYTKTTPFSPFPLTTEYSPAVNGGSGYFDGTGDYASLSGNSAFAIATSSTPFTIETWIYPTASGGIIFTDSYTGGGDTISIMFGLGTIGDSNGLTPYLGCFNGSAYSGDQSNVALTLNTWSHVACVFTGSAVAIYINGTSVAITGHPTGGRITSWPVTGDNGDSWYIGRRWDANTPTYITGYLSSLRFVNNSAVYSGNFTPSTTPLTAIANTSLLCNFTNAGIFDNTGFNNLETVGNAQIDTTVKKYGTGSMEFDGTGDYLSSAPNIAQSLEGGDFTIEAWLYNRGYAGSQYGRGWFTIYPAASYGSSRLMLRLTNINDRVNMYLLVGGSTYFGVSGTNSSAEVTANSWVHVAFVRQSGTFRLYINGILDTTISGVTISLNNFDKVEIGRNQDGATPDWNGYIDDLRITKGVARYTTTFTPPTAAFPNIGEP